MACYLAREHQREYSLAWLHRYHSPTKPRVRLLKVFMINIPIVMMEVVGRLLNILVDILGAAREKCVGYRQHNAQK